MDNLKRVGSCLAAVIAAVAAGSGNARATPLNFVTVRAPLHCLLSMPCAEVQWVDTVATIGVSSQVLSGMARLETRTFKASFPPTGQKNFYEYRVDLTQAVTTADAACVTDLAIDFGPLIKLQYNATGQLDHGYVLQGSGSAVGLLAVDQTGGVITFTFNEPICAATTPGTTGQASRVFGLASPFPPKAIVAKVSVPGLDLVGVNARAPQHR